MTPGRLRLKLRSPSLKAREVRLISETESKGRTARYRGTLVVPWWLMPNNQTETSASKAPIGAAKPDAKYLSYRTDAVPTDSLWPEVPLSS